jgi:hypothetical protein
MLNTKYVKILKEASWPIIGKCPTSSLKCQLIATRQASFRTVGLQLLRQSTGILTSKPRIQYLSIKNILNKCEDCLMLFYNILEYVSARTWWSGTEFAYVRVQHFILPKCFLCAKERSLISYFPRKLGNPFTFYYVWQVTLYSQKFDSRFYIPRTSFHFNVLPLHSCVASYVSVDFLLGYITAICFVIYTCCWFVGFLFAWIMGCIIGSCFMIFGFLHRFIVKFVGLLIGWCIC